MKKQAGPDAHMIALGFRVKTGRAIAVVLRGPVESPSFVRREDLTLVDPKMRSTFQPFHAVMELPWPDAVAAAEESASAIRAVATSAIAALLNQLRATGDRVAGAGVVGGSPNDPAKIGNPHVRAHAAEGQLFPRMVTAAANANGLTARSFPERGFEDRIIAELGLSPAAVKKRTAELGAAAGRPWRSDEKMAALAAWLFLAG